MFKTYISITKPGIIMGNAITATGGFLLASKGNFEASLLIPMLIGLALIIAAGCVFNNCIDRHADQKMERTKNRAIAKGAISVEKATLFAGVLGIVGVWVLYIFTNPLTLSITIAGFLGYVFLYSLSKYRTEYGTLIGSFAGAIPPVVGYTAASGHLDVAALLLFIIVGLWQMPHFYAIAIYRLRDYQAASIPVLPVKKGIPVTKKHMLFYILAFVLATGMLTLLGYTGYAYLIVAGMLGLSWVALSLKGFKAQNDQQWARKMFVLSIIVITALSITMAIDSVESPHQVACILPN